jgi:hypothetical protein
MDYELDPTFTTPPMMDNPMMMDKPMMTPPMDKTYVREPEVLRISAPTFRLVLPFASFDRSTPTRFAGSILNWTALIACFLWVFFLGKYGFMSGKSLSVYVVAMIFTIATTALLSSSGYQNR